jgi:hypothetical protein
VTQLRFNHARHEYSLNGQVLPGVTSVLKEAGLTPDFGMVDPDVLDKAARLGRQCDTMIEMDVLGLLDVDSLDEELKGYYDAWRDFLQCSGFRPTKPQLLVHSAKYGYAGQLDLLGNYGEGDSEQLWLIDTKRVASVPFSTRFQTMAYSQAYSESKADLRTPKRFALQLKRDGRKRWSLIPYSEDAADLRVFLAALTIYNAKRMQK